MANLTTTFDALAGAFGKEATIALVETLQSVGLVIVPGDPTPEMIEAAHADNAAEIWEAMMLAWIGEADG